MSVAAVSPLLTIGMPTYDDFDGVFFSIQSLRLYHDLADVELLVIDNSPPDSPHRQAVANLCGAAGARYVQAPRLRGPAAAKNAVFAHAAGQVVLCMDGHVMLAPGALDALRRYLAERPDASDLLGGPLVYDDLVSFSTHFDNRWRGEMWGTWGQAWRCECGHVFSLADGEARDLWTFAPLETCPQCGLPLHPAGGLPGARVAEPGDTRPVPIPAQGCGLMVCRRDAWLGFPEAWRGFGGEEFYIHERFRQVGRQFLLLPELRWLHRFGRPGGVRYPLQRYAKVRNYVIGHQELGLALDPIHEHFVASGLLPQSEWDHLLSDPLAHVDPPAKEKSSCGGCGAARQAAEAEAAASKTLEELYEAAWKTPSDIHEHSPKLRELAAQCQHVTEFGMRKGVSTVALLAGQPAVFVSYASAEHALDVQLLAKRGATDYRPLTGTSLGVEIEPTDLLFLDTRHTADHLYQELTRHATKVRRWIAMHDTQIFGERGEDGGPGLLPALRRFMRERPEWSVVYHTQANHGLTVIGCRGADKPELPGTLALAANFARAVADHVADGMKSVAVEVLESRLAQCSLCDQRNADRCSVCGCYIAKKAAWRTSDCPLGKWPPLEATP